MKPRSYIIDDPKLMSEWDWDVNDDLDPKKLTSGSNKKAWWKCGKCNGKWYASICERIGHNTGCPYCAGQKVLKGYNDLSTKKPEILNQWHPTKNGNLSPDSIMPNSKTKIWWICSKGHEFEQAVVDRIQHPLSCPICSGQRVAKGINDLESRYPNVAKEWNYAKNENIVPSNITWGSNKKFWWKCLNCGHEWQARVSDRTRGHNGCPACSNRVLAVGINDLSTKYPEIATEWDYAENGNLAPKDFIYNSKKIVWWKCPNGHEYTQTLYNRTCKSKSCPYCKVKIAKGITRQLIKKSKETNKQQKVYIYKPINDLATKYPEVAKEWHPTKNGDLTPSDVSVGSKKRVWWMCPKGHEYEQYIGRKTLRGSGCPICSGHRLLSGFNDFETKFPEVAAEWHPTKNGSLKPSEVTSGSGKRVWWRCPIGHDYQAVVRDRGIGQTGCPICNKRKTSSFPEQAILYYIKKIYPNAINKYKECFNNAMEFDVYIPELKVAIEYDGCNWHKTEEEHKREVKKYKFCKKHDIHLIRIKEKNGLKWDDTYDEVYYVKPVKRNNLSELEKIINYVLNSLTVSIDNLIDDWHISANDPYDIHTVFKYKPFKLFHHGVDVNLERDKSKILSYLSRIENSLSDLRPDVAVKWNYERNGDLVPNMFSVGSNEKVWWKCPDCGHEWQSSIIHITKSTVGCPICALKYRGKSFSIKRVRENGSLAINKPEIAAQWHPTKNGDTTPFDITEKNCNLFWWLCPKCGHEWQSSPNNRSKGSGCPACSGRVPKQGTNDLLSKYPDIAKLWNYEKNDGLKPNQFLPGSHKNVWWKCPVCHSEWQRGIWSQVHINNCPHCSKHKNQLELDITKN